MKTKFALFALFFCALTAALPLNASQSPQFVTIYQFGVSNNIPGAGLTLGPNGQLFGTTYGGAYYDGAGSVYELTPGGNGAFNFKELYRFDSAYSPPDDGQSPYAGVTVSPDGTTLYGTTTLGGSNNAGVIFSLNIADAESYALVKPHNPQPKGDSLGYAIRKVFKMNDEGGAPKGDLETHANFGVALAILFGTLSSDGPNDGGAVFSFDPSGQFDTTVKIIHEHNQSGADGSNPQNKLVVTSSGKSSSVQKTGVKADTDTNIDLSTFTLYGITKSGGTNNYGVVYKVDGNGSNYTVLHHFSLKTSDGAIPFGGMALSGNTLYGTTSFGGSNYNGTVFQINTDGSNFKIIANFKSATTGDSPQGDLILSGDTLYGTTYDGGAGGGGTVFSINTNGGNFTVLHSFTLPMDDGNGHYTNSDGGWSVAGLLLSGYTLYGTAPYGGTNGVGTAYEIILPSPPSLAIAKPAGNYAIAWPSSATNFVLQSNSALNSLTWSNFTGAVNDDGTNKSIGIVPTVGSAFFRLLNTNSP